MPNFMSAWVYILRLQSGNLYVGATTDLKTRYKTHQQGLACRTTEKDPPVDLVYSEVLESFVEARRREAQIKRWARAKKEALVAGDKAKLRTLSKSREHTKE
jgi:predicted GIY-YIG superfamily endonuclease